MNTFEPRWNTVRLHVPICRIPLPIDWQLALNIKTLFDASYPMLRLRAHIDFNTDSLIWSNCESGFDIFYYCDYHAWPRHNILLLRLTQKPSKLMNHSQVFSDAYTSCKKFWYKALNRYPPNLHRTALWPWFLYSVHVQEHGFLCKKPKNALNDSK